MVSRVAIVGAGNVATHLAVSLSSAGVDVCAVCARHMDSALRLAERVGAQAVTECAQIFRDVDYIIISVSDSMVGPVAESLPCTDAVVVHTSGSVPLEVVAERHQRAGVLYPLQTFSRDIAVDVSQVPFFTEATDADTLAEVDRLAHMLSQNVYHADSDRRRYLHVAGVMSSNFTVYLLEQCREVLARAGYPLDVVRPLVGATVAKVFASSPREAMTGPARRGDLAVADAHMRLLGGEAGEIYKAISTEIYKMYHELD